MIPIMLFATNLFCIPESPACFTSKARIFVSDIQYDSITLSQDLPTPGFANRWHYIFDYNPEIEPLIALGRVNAEICGAAIIWQPENRGGMYQEGNGYWRIEMLPLDDAVAAQFALWDGLSECRNQEFIVSRIGAKAVEILIEELE